MPSILSLLALPALATAAALQSSPNAAVTPRQAPLVTFASARTIGGNGCPAGNFGYTVNASGTTGTLIFDVFQAYVGPTSPPDTREKFCDFEVIFQFPLGCTTGTITTIPRGTIRLESGFSSTWHSQYTISPGTLGPNPANVVTSSSDLPVTPGSWYDYTITHPISVRENILNQNQRNVTFTARTRIFLTAPGPTRESTLIIDAADISVENTATC
ncbi:hypothetical protein QBC44DRAFT_306117 [Cladorrhinum sp. PSN332]|nr:hypothetical protein QBC44DRAFT_306117 [Cladorrhinum sp. PSN332]